MKNIIYSIIIPAILILLLTISYTYANECQDEVESGISCTILTPSNVSCDTYNLYAENGSAIALGASMSEIYSGSGIYSISFQQTTVQGYVVQLCDGTSKSIRVGNTTRDRIDDLESQITTVDTVVDTIDTKVDTIDTNVDTINTNVNTIDGIVDTILTRVNTIIDDITMYLKGINIKTIYKYDGSGLITSIEHITDNDTDFSSPDIRQNETFNYTDTYYIDTVEKVNITI